ncbi:MAG: hypothetical protein ACRDFB_00940, partial [Rhabdochlamydiaceae bacterium]
VRSTKFATGELLRDKDITKLGYNIKFEQRYTMKEFGFKARNWKWDGMIASHVIDNRRGITGLKFQSFVLLGQPPYNDHIEPFLKPKKMIHGANTINQINEISLQQLLLYCGMDSLLEFLVCKKQMKMISTST